MERKARFAGLWYPAGGRELDEITDFDKRGGDCRMAVLPHAGLYYSGRLISAFFSVLDSNVDHVVIIAPSHYHRILPGVFTTATFTSAETPYGSVEATQLDCVPHVVDDRAVADEHAVEMFLPFIARHGNLSVSFALVGSAASHDVIVALADCLAGCIDERTAVIASSDFTHYGRRFGYEPYGKGALEKVVEHDAAAANLLASGMTEEVWDTYYGKSTICGIVPAMTVSRLAAMEGLKGAVTLHATSADDGGDRSDFVSYFDVFWRK